MAQVVPAWLAKFAADQSVLCASRSAAMQRITDVLARDYTHFVQVEVGKEKVATLLEKFQARYPMLTKTRNVASKAKAKGKPRQKVVVFWHGAEQKALIYLLTDTPTDEHREKWIPVYGTSNRVTFYQFEAVRHVRGGTLSWSWRMNSQEFEKLVDFMVTAVRKNADEKLEISIYETRTWPGFSVIRKQHNQLRERLKGEWARSARDGEPPRFPRLYYLQRKTTR